MGMQRDTCTSSVGLISARPAPPLHGQCPASSLPGRARGLAVAVLLAAASLAGCRAPTASLVTGRVDVMLGTNHVVIEQPKDTVFERLEFDPVTGRFVLIGYQSSANAGAIAAETARWEAMGRAFEAGIGAAERGAIRYFSGGLANPAPAGASGPRYDLAPR